MKKILIVGVSRNIGGIEKFFYEIFKEKSSCFDVTFMCFGKQCAFADEYLANGYKVDVLPARKENPLTFSRSVKSYLRAHNEFDYVWVNTLSTSMYQFQYYTKKMTKAKVITHSHGTKFEKSGNLLYHFGNVVLDNLNYKKVINNTDMFFCCSKVAGISLFGKRKKNELVVINNGIDCNKFIFNNLFRNEIRKEFNIQKDTLLLGMVGRLSAVKNPLRAIAIFTNILHKRPDAKLLIVGTGEMRLEIEEEIKKNKLGDHVVFTGLRSDVYRFYSALDLLIMPSFSEGLPLSAIEAQCSGLNCVLSKEITQEVAITDLVSFVDLNSEDEYWANAILDLSEQDDRRAYCEVVKKRGYDSTSVRYYIEGILT